jgi:hypothetical protein
MLLLWWKENLPLLLPCRKLPTARLLLFRSFEPASALLVFIEIGLL